MIALVLAPLIACTSSGKIILPDKDTGEGPLEERSWSGIREMDFENQCTFSIYEEGDRITDRSNEVYQNIEASCTDCQVFRLHTTPDFTDCGDLGTIGTGGERYRAIRYTDFGLDIWYIYPPSTEQYSSWNVDLIATAQGDDSDWMYTIEDHFQAFLYTSTGQFSLDP